MSKKRSSKLEDVNIQETMPLTPPEALKNQIKATRVAMANVLRGRNAIKGILAQTDNRLLVIAGPCSIHRPEEAIEYARWLREMQAKFKTLLLVMRVYLAKPRTTIGWKGLIYDPHLDGSERIDTGLRQARELMSDINDMRVPCGIEFVDTLTPQFLADLTAWSCIGARTVEAQPHRELASGLSMPVGFKNSTDGNIQVAIDGVEAARHAHSFLSIDARRGQISMVRTKGNPWCHIILRGGNAGPNFSPGSIREAAELLIRAKHHPVMVVDCSHGNSRKKPELQEEAWCSVVDQRAQGTAGLVGLMLESNLLAGSQKVDRPLHLLDHGRSITDACIDTKTTERLLEYAVRKLSS